MASSKLDYMWNLMSENVFIVSTEFPNDDLFCVICKKLVTDAFVSGVCGCQYCHNCIREYVNNEKKYCPGGKEDCTDDFVALGRNVIRNDRLNKRISRVKVNCLNKSCACNIELIKMSEHLKLCKKQSMDCPYVAIGCNSDKVDRDTIESHLNSETATHSELLIGIIRKLMNESEKRRIEICNMREESRIYKNKIAMLEEDLKNVRNEIEHSVNKETREEVDARLERHAMTTMVTDLRKDVDGMTEWMKNCDEKKGGKINKCDKLYPNIVEDFRWKIDKLSTKRITDLYSESFYSKSYKLCLCLWIWGGDIYLHCYLMKGDYDDMLEWPMRGTVALSIVDQVTLTAHKTQTYKYETFKGTKCAFDRPSENRNDRGIGSSLIKYSAIKDKSSIVVNDSIVVSCAVYDR